MVEGTLPFTNADRMLASPGFVGPRNKKQHKKAKHNMKTISKTVLYLQMTALFLTTALAGPAAAEKEVPFCGSIETVAISSTFEFPFLSASSIGTGKATHLGRFTATWEIQINVTTLTATGTYVFTAANGDTLFTTFEAFGFPTDDPFVVHIVEAHTITGGTGRFAGATGSFVHDALANQALEHPTTSGSLEGSIVLDKGN
jgi:hypothetical protein